jgi:hypothetical protein
MTWIRATRAMGKEKGSDPSPRRVHKGMACRREIAVSWIRVREKQFKATPPGFPNAFWKQLMRLASSGEETPRGMISSWTSFMGFQPRPFGILPTHAIPFSKRNPFESIQLLRFQSHEYPLERTPRWIYPLGNVIWDRLDVTWNSSPGMYCNCVLF